MKKLALIISLIFGIERANALQIIIGMGDAQKDHLKSYGIAYWVLSKGGEVDWLLNYDGGSFLFNFDVSYENECKIRGVSYEVITESKANSIHAEISNPETNMESVKLLKAPKIAVYSPKSKQPWDDAVTMVLEYAEIPYDKVFDDEVIDDKLLLYDWLHLHHEDFTGQYGKFWSSYRNADWYIEEVKENEACATRNGYAKVSEMKLVVSKKIRDFVLGGGFLFAMCSATDTYDIALAAEGVDICESMFDGDGMDPNAQNKLNFNNTFAFKDFKIEKSPYAYEHASIDNTIAHQMVTEQTDYFTLFDFSAKWDVIPTMLCQNHTQTIKGFMGQTTGFRKEQIKSEVLILGETKSLNEARYIHGSMGKGTWTFYGGHDPEDYQHFIEEPPTNLSLFPNSPGYRLILNNILFPSAKKKKLKT
ncbi:MAG: asparagine synthetase B [Bacteroidia bacterium]|nr:asparagine synthetase B [Bacteroidia bacterium]